MRFLPVFVAIFILLSACESKPDCANSDKNEFDSFLGITSQTKEVELPEILGESTGGYYTEDGLNFVYTYHAVTDVPVAVVVNSTTAKVETVVMEVLSLEDHFFIDLETAKKHFQMSDCDARFFGMKREELIEEMGSPDKEDLLDGGIKSVVYNSDDFRTSVNFKFYPEQAHMCSSVIVSWF